MGTSALGILTEFFFWVWGFGFRGLGFRETILDICGESGTHVLQQEFRSVVPSGLWQELASVQGPPLPNMHCGICRCATTNFSVLEPVLNRGP